MAAIPTFYDGTRYRSLLEAHWAAFFTRIGWNYDYEPFEAAYYIPDFHIRGARPLLAEIKPAATPDEYRHPIAKITDGLIGMDHQWTHDVLILGASPMSPIASAHAGRDTAGLLGEPSGDTEWDYGPACWFMCATCCTVGVFHDYLSFQGRPCGCYQGTSHLGATPHRVIESAWRAAGNDVQWNSG
jgi:hypothetical protein